MESGRDVWGGALTLFHFRRAGWREAGGSMEVAPPGLMSDDGSHGLGAGVADGRVSTMTERSDRDDVLIDADISCCGGPAVDELAWNRGKRSGSDALSCVGVIDTAGEPHREVG